MRRGGIGRCPLHRVRRPAHPVSCVYASEAPPPPVRWTAGNVPPEPQGTGDREQVTEDSQDRVRSTLQCGPPPRGPSPWRFAPVPPPKQPGGGTKARCARGYSARGGQSAATRNDAIEQPLPVRERWTA